MVKEMGLIWLFFSARRWNSACFCNRPFEKSDE